MNSTKDLYQGVKKQTNKFRPTVDNIKDIDNKVLCEGEEVKNRWKQYCYDLYKKNNNITTIITNTDNYGIWHENPPPLHSEVEKAIQEIKKGKSPSTDEIASELI